MSFLLSFIRGDREINAAGIRRGPTIAVFYRRFIGSRANLIKKLCRSCFTSVSKGNKLPGLKLKALSRSRCFHAKFRVMLWIIETILRKVKVNFSINRISACSSGLGGALHLRTSSPPRRNPIDIHYPGISSLFCYPWCILPRSLLRYILYPYREVWKIDRFEFIRNRIAELRD